MKTPQCEVLDQHYSTYLGLRQ